MCETGTMTRERFPRSAATAQELRVIDEAHKAFLQAPSCFAGIAVFGRTKEDRTMCMSLAQIKRSDVCSDAEMFREVFGSFELIAMEMHNDDAWPCLEFLISLRTFSKFSVVRICKDGNFERWRFGDVLKDIHEKGRARNKRRAGA